eukprot:403339881
MGNGANANNICQNENQALELKGQSAFFLSSPLSECCEAPFPFNQVLYTALTIRDVKVSRRQNIKQNIKINHEYLNTRAYPLSMV